MAPRTKTPATADASPAAETPKTAAKAAGGTRKAAAKPATADTAAVKAAPKKAAAAKSGAPKAAAADKGTDKPAKTAAAKPAKAVKTADKTAAEKPAAKSRAKGPKSPADLVAKVPADLVAEIEREAYHLWMNEGCPHGRDRDHWIAAEEIVRGRHKVA